MLRKSDIIHNGLKDIYAAGRTQHPAPPGHLVRPCDRRLKALGWAKSIRSKSLLGILIIPRPPAPNTNNLAYEMPISSNTITFQWNSTYALQVDWV